MVRRYQIRADTNTNKSLVQKEAFHHHTADLTADSCTLGVGGIGFIGRGLECQKMSFCEHMRFDKIAAP